ncbi:hypothetical protein A2215_00210 [Candidatus Berkelbacteria bacterium RIFOXYA2_FULL_43_10]|uniref:Uncharacterized protein n=1 Tax=Candidatus Berkelbacteria bacterium RIFOXYA2_FULL_43_10 TaxID=1797472 RepID=A0A1F5E9L7_9BACT|nr:MAG: hypothetical protein A2215_00210 [Candidatus Berkelbacteria bacterium RIFOXYA2_FULL_43_10]
MLKPRKTHSILNGDEIISPSRSKSPSVVLVAGKNAHQARIYDVGHQLEQRELDFYKLINRGMTVSIVGA